jgi:hypothetical protein
LAAGDRPVGQGLDQGVLVAGLDRAAPQRIEPQHQSGPLQIEGRLQLRQGRRQLQLLPLQGGAAGGARLSDRALVGVAFLTLRPKGNRFTRRVRRYQAKKIPPRANAHRHCDVGEVELGNDGPHSSTVRRHGQQVCASGMQEHRQGMDCLAGRSTADRRLGGDWVEQGTGVQLRPQG